MNRRTFLKQLPIVATLPFLPNLPELPETEQILTERELDLIFKTLDEATREVDTKRLFNQIAEGVGEFASEGLSATDTVQRLEKGLAILLERNNLYG